MFSWCPLTTSGLLVDSVMFQAGKGHHRPAVVSALRVLSMHASSCQLRGVTPEVEHQDTSKISQDSSVPSSTAFTKRKKMLILAHEKGISTTINPVPPAQVPNCPLAIHLPDPQWTHAFGRVWNGKRCFLGLGPELTIRDIHSFFK